MFKLPPRSRSFSWMSLVTSLPVLGYVLLNPRILESNSPILPGQICREKVAIYMSDFMKAVATCRCLPEHSARLAASVFLSTLSQVQGCIVQDRELRMCMSRL